MCCSSHIYMVVSICPQVDREIVFHVGAPTKKAEIIHGIFFGESMIKMSRLAISVTLYIKKYSSKTVVSTNMTTYYWPKCWVILFHLVAC